MTAELAGPRRQPGRGPVVLVAAAGASDPHPRRGRPGGRAGQCRRLPGQAARLTGRRAGRPPVRAARRPIRARPGFPCGARPGSRRSRVDGTLLDPLHADCRAGRVLAGRPGAAAHPAVLPAHRERLDPPAAVALNPRIPGVHPPGITSAPTGAMWRCDGQGRRVVTLRRFGRGGKVKIVMDENYVVWAVDTR